MRRRYFQLCAYDHPITQSTGFMKNQYTGLNTRNSMYGTQYTELNVRDSMYGTQYTDMAVHCFIKYLIA